MISFSERRQRQDSKKKRIELFGISFACVFAVLLILVCIPLGAFTHFFWGVFGISIYPICALCILFGIGMYLSQRYSLQKRYFVYLILNFVFLMCLLHAAIGSKALSDARIADFGKYLSNCYKQNPTITCGGVLAGVLIYPLVCLIGVVGVCVVFAILLCIFVGLSIDFMFVRKNKLSKKDIERNRRVIEDDNSAAYSNVGGLDQDYDTRAKKLVPKKFEKEDYDRYSPLQTGEEGANYYQSMLQGNQVDNVLQTQQTEEIATNPANDLSVERSAPCVEEQQPQPTTETDSRAWAKNLLFGNRTGTVSNSASQQPAAKVESPVEKVADEKYPSKYDENLFASKIDYITTPYLPDHLNRREFDRNTVLNRNKQMLMEKQASNFVPEAREETTQPFIPNVSVTPVRNTEFLRSESQNVVEPKTENAPQQNDLFDSASEKPAQSFSAEQNSRSNLFINRMSERLANQNTRQEPENAFDQRNDIRETNRFNLENNRVNGLENNRVNGIDARPNMRVGENRFEQQNVREIRNENRTESRFDNISNRTMPSQDDSLEQILPRQTFTPEDLNKPFVGQDVGMGEQRLQRGVRGPDRVPRKTPDRSGIGSNGFVSDMVEQEKPRQPQQNIVAPKPSFFENKQNVQSAPVQQSLLGNNQASFGTDRKQPVDTKYVAPTPNLLTTVSDDPTKYGGDTAEKSRILEETLDSFRIGAKVSNVIKGPSVTRYELSIPAGIPVKKLANYESNIAMTLMSKNGVRLELPIPGKNAVGVEIPNDSPCTVGLKDMILSREFQSASGNLPVAIGKNINGEYVVKSLAKMVHLLVAGSTGSGKSVFLHNLILSLMFKSSPEQLRFIMIDPKRVEFVVYNNMPHMMLPNVVTECDKAINALAWATKEMDRRYRMFNQHLVNDIETYNKCPEVQSGEEKKIPYIVIVIDELADLMMLASKEVERHIQRIAQLGRACGIHLVIATQRPTVQYVTGTIKANLPTRVAFALASAIDSKTILDEGGAEKLIGKGDMLFSPQNASSPMRLQAAFATLEEVKRVVAFLKEHNACYYDEEVEKEIMAEPEEQQPAAVAQGGEQKGDNVDEFFYPALRLFIETGTASTTMIQRRFGVGFARAARLVDQMEVKGYVSPQNGSKKRNVYITMEQYRELSGDED